MKNVKYVSETTKFLNNLLSKNPSLHQKRCDARKLWWDKEFIDQKEQQAYQDSEVKPHDYE